MLTSLTTGLIAVAIGIAGALPQAPSAPMAVASWSMVPLVKDVNRDGVIDGDGGVPTSGSFTKFPAARLIGAGNRVAQPNERLIDGRLSWYLGAGLPVRLDACRSTIGAEHRWVVDGTPTAWSPLTRKGCARTIDLLEGPHAVTLEVRRAGRIARSALDVTATNILLVALGDSYASGEGNPRNVDAWIASPGAFDAYWDDAACHRSVLGGPARAALALEQASPRTSVTLVDVACSGATIEQGILGPQPNAAGLSQIEQVRQIVGDRPIDAVTISIGGNDVGFGSVLETCLLATDCPLTRPTGGVLAGFPTVQQGVQARTGELPSLFARVAGCLGGASCTISGPGTDAPLVLSAGAPVVPMLYPDITRAASGAPCSVLGMSRSDFSWARSSMLVPQPGAVVSYTRANGTAVSLPLPNGSLNGQVQATAGLGWHPATGTWDASGSSPVGHGVCAGPQAWAFDVTAAILGQPNAAFHPNPTGQQQVAAALAAAVQAALPPVPAP